MTDTEPTRDHARPDGGAVVREGLLVLAVMAVAGVLLGVVWSWVVDPVVATRTDAGVLRSEVELGKQVGADGWFVVLGLVGCFLHGVVLTAWRRLHEVVTVAAVVVGSLLAAVLCDRLGTLLGPDPATETLARAAVGDTAPDQIFVSAGAAYLAWPLGAAVGALGVLLILGSSGRSVPPSVVQWSDSDRRDRHV